MVKELIAFDKKVFRIALISSGIETQAKLAEKLGMSLGHLCSIIGGFLPSDELQQRIARELKLKSPSELWIPVRPVKS